MFLIISIVPDCVYLTVRLVLRRYVPVKHVWLVHVDLLGVVHALLADNLVQFEDGPGGQGTVGGCVKQGFATDTAVRKKNKNHRF